MLEQNPIYWLAMRCKPAAPRAWIFAALPAIGIAVALITGSILVSPGFALFTCFCVNAGFKLYASSCASAFLARDRGEYRLELLLSTPITPREMIHGHVRALHDTLRPIVRGALLFEVILLTFAILLNWNRNARSALLCIITSLAVVGFLLPDLRAVGWDALWRGVISRHSREAAQEANQRVLILPWIPCALVWAIVQAVGGPFYAFFAAIVSCALLSVVADVWFARCARHNLETQLVIWAQRRAAGELEHYDGWRRVGRRLGKWWSSRGKVKPN